MGLEDLAVLGLTEFVVALSWMMGDIDREGEREERARSRQNNKAIRRTTCK